MPSSKLQHYLRTHRKRGGFSQKEIAYLLASEKAEGRVSRYENLLQEPSLRTALAFEVIYRVSIRELFAGLYDEVEQRTLQRARTLSERLNESDPPLPRCQKRRQRVEGALLSLLVELQKKHDKQAL